MKTMTTTAAIFAASIALAACGGGDEDGDGIKGTGGAAEATGGATNGTGGVAEGTGGADGTGGAADGTGGEAFGTGGAAEGTGGADDGTGGTGGGEQWIPGELLTGTSAQICEIQVACDYQILGQADCVSLFDLFFQQAQIDECYTCLVETPDCDTQSEICFDACSL